MLLRILAVCAVLGLVACGGDDPAAPGSETNLSATLDGGAWVASISRTATFQNTVLTINGQNSSGQTIQIAIALLVTSGTYSIGPGNANAALGNVIDGTAIWASSLQGGSGTITISHMSQTRVIGSFNFVAVPATGSATGTRTVANGHFDLPLN